MEPEVEIPQEVREAYGLEVFDPPVPKSVKVAEAPGHGQSVLEHAPRSKGATAYRELAERIFGKTKRSRKGTS